jgi:hypothetical protein
LTKEEMAKRIEDLEAKVKRQAECLQMVATWIEMADAVLPGQTKITVQGLRSLN